MLSHFTCSRGEPQAAFPPSPCAKSDNMSSNKKSPPQGSAESKLYRAGLRSLYTIVVAVDICPCPSNTNISRLVSVVKRVSIFVRQNIVFVVAFGATAPPSPHGQRGAAFAPSHSQQRAARHSLIARMVTLACGASCLRRGGSPSYGDALHITAWQAGRLAYSLLCQGQAAVFCDRIRKSSAVKHDP